MPRRSKKKSPNKAHRNGITITELHNLFPNEESAEKWFIESRWNRHIHCPKCGSINISEKVNHNPRKWRCNDCRTDFTAKTNSILHNSKIGFRKWVMAIYLFNTSLKGVSSLKLHRDIGVSKQTAWYMGHRIREAHKNDESSYWTKFWGTNEVDETHVGGFEKNKHKNKKLNMGRGSVGKLTVIAVKNRDTNKIKAKVIKNSTKETFHDFISKNVNMGSDVHTDEHTSYKGLGHKGYSHDSVTHSKGIYVKYNDLKNAIHVNGVESFWAMLKRGYKGTYHSMSEKHLQRYVNEFVGRHNVREMDTLNQMAEMVREMNAKRLAYKDLVGKSD